MFVTPLYAGLLALWFVLLSVRVVNLRRRGSPFGDNGDIKIKRIVRAQANFAEYVPLALLSRRDLLRVGGLSALGLTLLIARILHGLALSFGRQVPFGRATGAGLTFIVLLIEAVLCLYQGFRGQWLWFQ